MVTVNWTVLNQGVATGVSQWTDRIVLSADNIIGNADDVVLASVVHNGALAGGDTYTGSQAVTIPQRLQGNYYISVVTDALAQVLEPDTRSNNASQPGASIVLTAPYSDLQVEVVSAPTSVQEGGNVALVWRVRNVGDVVTDVSAWKDNVYLSTDATLDAGDLRITGGKNSRFRMAEQTFRKARAAGVPTVVVLGGGYAPSTLRTAELHAITIEEALRVHGC